MATALSSLKAYIKDITKCPICLDDCEDPRSLPCLHTFCLKCIDSHCRDRCPGDDVECPVCRKVFQIPDVGVEGIQHNFFVSDLISVDKTSADVDNHEAEHRATLPATDAVE